MAIPLVPITGDRFHQTSKRLRLRTLRGGSISMCLCCCHLTGLSKSILWITSSWLFSAFYFTHGLSCCWNLLKCIRHMEAHISNCVETAVRKVEICTVDSSAKRNHPSLHLQVVPLRIVICVSEHVFDKKNSEKKKNDILGPYWQENWTPPFSIDQTSCFSWPKFEYTLQKTKKRVRATFWHQHDRQEINPLQPFLWG